MAADNSKSYLGYLNNCVHRQYNNTYHRSIDKKPVHADYFPLTD